MNKTEINKLVQQELHCSSQEAARLVSNAIRDRILTEIAVVKTNKRGRPPKKYMLVRSTAETG